MNRLKHTEFLPPEHTAKRCFNTCWIKSNFNLFILNLPSCSLICFPFSFTTQERVKNNFPVIPPYHSKLDRFSSYFPQSHHFSKHFPACRAFSLLLAFGMLRKVAQHNCILLSTSQDKGISFWKPPS